MNTGPMDNAPTMRSWFVGEIVKEPPPFLVWSRALSEIRADNGHGANVRVPCPWNCIGGAPSLAEARALSRTFPGQVCVLRRGEDPNATLGGGQ